MLLEHQPAQADASPANQLENNGPNQAPLFQSDTQLRTRAYASAQVVRISAEVQNFQPNTPENQFLSDELTQKDFTKCLENSEISINYKNDDSYTGQISNTYLLTPKCTPKKFFALTDIDNGKFQRSGEGTYSWADGGVFRGTFENNLPNGQGSLIKSDGTEYTGTWTDGLLQGDKCVVLFPEDSQSLAQYEGGFVGNLAEGRGKLTFRLGDVFKGFFRNGVYDGKGTMRYSNGDAYDGKYVAGLPHGAGTFHYKSVNIFQNTKLQGGIDRVNSTEFKNSMFDLKSKKPGEQTIPASMCGIAMRANPNKNLAKTLLGGLFDRDTNRVIKGNKVRGKTQAKSSRTTAATTARTTAKSSTKKKSPKANQGALSKRAPQRDNSQYRSVRKISKKLKTATSRGQETCVVIPQEPKFDLTSRKRGVMVDMRQVFVGGDSGLGFGLKRATSMDLCILAAKATLRRSKNMIVD